jgi:hypothetical protein
MCNCYDAYFGVDRTHMIDALNGFCNNVAGLTFGPASYPGATYAWYYPVNSLTDEEGVIAAKFTWTGGNGENPNDCSQPVTMIWDACVRGMHAPIDLW